MKTKLTAIRESVDDRNVFTEKIGSMRTAWSWSTLNTAGSWGFVGYEVEDIRNFCGTIGIYPVKSVDYDIFVEKGTLMVGHGDSSARLSLEGGRRLRGRLSYAKGSSRRVRVELVIKRKWHVLSDTLPLFETTEGGEYEFEFEPPNVRDVFLILYTGDPTITPRKLLKAIGLGYPVVFGKGWEVLNTEVRLVLDLPGKLDVSDSTRITLSPLWERTSCS